jgi:hypothetical protein
MSQLCIRRRRTTLLCARHDVIRTLRSSRAPGSGDYENVNEVTLLSEKRHLPRGARRPLAVVPPTTWSRICGECFSADVFLALDSVVRLAAVTVEVATVLASKLVPDIKRGRAADRTSDPEANWGL